MADRDNTNTNANTDSERVHEAYQKLGHLGGEARKQQMAEGEIFTKENPQNPGEGRSSSSERSSSERSNRER